MTDHPTSQTSDSTLAGNSFQSVQQVKTFSSKNGFNPGIVLIALVWEKLNIGATRDRIKSILSNWTALNQPPPQEFRIIFEFRTASRGNSVCHHHHLAFIGNPRKIILPFLRSGKSHSKGATFECCLTWWHNFLRINTY